MEQKNLKKTVETPPADDFSAIPKTTLNLLTKFITEKTIEVYNGQVKEGREKNKDCRLKNTRLLLKKYRWFKSFSGNAVTELTQLLSEEEIAFFEAMGMESFETRRIESIKDRVVFTNTVLGHVDTMLGLYKEKCLESGREELSRRWRILEAMYLSETVTTAEDVADQEHINDRTVYKDLNAAITDLSGLFFGVDLSEIFWL